FWLSVLLLCPGPRLAHREWSGCDALCPPELHADEAPEYVVPFMCFKHGSCGSVCGYPRLWPDFRSDIRGGGRKFAGSFGLPQKPHHAEAFARIGILVANRVHRLASSSASVGSSGTVSASAGSANPLMSPATRPWVAKAMTRYSTSRPLR